ncbi:MAG: ABC transporter ATP-binding protein [Oligoflexus sp.]
MIQVENLSKSFGNFHLLEKIDFAVKPGERVTIIGPGGCGKSTLLKILLGLEPPSSGSVNVMDLDMVNSKPKERQELLRKVGVAFQQGALFDYMTVEDNIRFAIEHMTDMSEQEAGEKIDQLLTAVKLPHTKSMYPYELSGGMQRRIGIVRAMATDPVLTFFDEPTSGLDPVTSTIILNMILDLAGQKEGNTLIVATSAVEIAMRFSERIIMLNEGVIAADGNWKDLLVDGPEWVQHFLSARLIGIDINYARELQLPEDFIKRHW